MLNIKVESTKTCDECCFQEFEGSECNISEHSGYDDYDDRNYDDNGYDAFKSCNYRLEYMDGVKILIWFIETQQHETID